MSKQRKEVRVKRVMKNGISPREWCWRILRVTGALILTCWAFGSYKDLLPLVAYAAFVPMAILCGFLTWNGKRMRSKYKRQRAQEFRNARQPWYESSEETDARVCEPHTARDSVEVSDRLAIAN